MVLDTVHQTIEEHHLLEPGDRLVAGVSGGPDSLCLLHLLLRLQEEFGLQLHAAHLNHQLRGEEAEADAVFVRQTAARWHVPLTVETTDVAALAAEHQMGLEEAARQARYAFLARVAGRVGATKIVVGHNADDQAETVLMHLLRGSGLAGLRGISPVLDIGGWRLGVGGWKLEVGSYLQPPTSCPRGIQPPISNLQPPTSNLQIIRPLLSVPRSAIEAYCQENRLRPRFDRSNLDTTFFRNRLRRQVLPALEEVAPGLSGRLRQLAELAAADYALLESVLDEKWRELLLEQCEGALILDLAKWRAAPLSLRRGALRRAVYHLRPHLRNLTFDHVESARRIAETGATGAASTLPGRLQLSVSYGRMIVGNQDFLPPPNWPALNSDDVVPLTIPGRTPLPGAPWQVEACLLPAGPEMCATAFNNQDAWRAFLDADVVGDTVVLRPRRPGERFQPLNMGGKSSSVANFMINCRIPAGWRDRLPILARPEHILWIAGRRLDHRARITAQTRQILRVSFLHSI